MRQLLLICAISKHRPNLMIPLKDDVPPVRRPGREIIGPIAMRQLNPLQAGDVHEINVLPTEHARAIVAIPSEGQELTVGRP